MKIVFPHPIYLWIPALLLLLFGTGKSVHAQANSSEADSLEWVERSWTALPSLFYSPKTKLGGGGSVRYFPRRQAGTRPTNIQFSFIYTARKQMVISLVPDLYFKEKNKRVYMSILYLDFPDTFFGIGNDAPLTSSEGFTSQIASFLVSGEQEIATNLSLGLQSWVRYEQLTEFKEGGLLESGTLTGSDKGTAVGVGTFLRWDTRDNYFYTNHGSFLRGSWMVFPPGIGSDYRFSRATLDARRFIPLSWRYVVALRSYTQTSIGDAPFQLLPQIGGRTLMRGYAEGRYKDNVLSVVQAEFRAYVWGPFGAVLFASAGDVQQRFSSLGSDKLIFAGGGGLRLLINDEGLNFRVDYGIGRDGGSLYFTLGEAF